MPIYFVITEQIRNPQFVAIYQIIKVIACDLADTNKLYKQEVVPLVAGTNRMIQTMYFYREPANPIREKAQEQQDRTVKVPAITPLRTVKQG